jgi:beta-glucanase (GH16 family)
MTLGPRRRAARWLVGSLGTVMAVASLALAAVGGSPPSSVDDGVRGTAPASDTTPTWGTCSELGMFGHSVSTCGQAASSNGTTTTSTPSSCTAVDPCTAATPTPSPNTTTTAPPTSSTAGAAGPADSGGAPCAATTPPIDPPIGTWSCTFDDEFNGLSLDTTKWQAVQTATSMYTTGPALSQVCYVDDPRTISEADGLLDLSVARTSSGGHCQGLNWIGTSTPYIGGMVESYQHFSQRYGYFQVRAAMPPTSIPGLQETMWMYPENQKEYGPWPDSGEIDYAEFYSNYSNYVVPALHYPGSGKDPNADVPCQLPTGQTPAGEFHTYALSWTPTTITTYYDGTPCITDVYAPYVASPDSPPQPFDQPFFMAFTSAFGSSGGNGFSVGTPLPATMQLDWVRVWQYS